ncbi:Conidiation-specific protein 6 [Penicillium italicum]|uniref:Conidiation-specific protein 6 n=1 Tax=Penicillium italicum TaxID=40296 RepID=A0A0A2K7L5_PENIT|nr:Conidiation-specific protein 6 [Penicillium italicum]
MPTEERLNEMRGYKASLSNPKVSQEAKHHSQDMLNELGGDQPRKELHQARGDQSKDPVRVSAGLKAAQQNPNVTEGGKQRAAEKMEQRSAPEE